MSSTTTGNISEAVLEDQLRRDCYELHAVRNEVADLSNKQRDVECRYEYLRTVLSNMERAEDQLKKTLDYETATSDAVLLAARNGNPLPPALAGDVATSILCPPVHVAPNDSKNLYQSQSDIQRKYQEEKKQLQKEIDDMDVVIRAERRSIGTLQHAMYAQAAWGDSVVQDRSTRNHAHNEALGEIATVQAESKTHKHQEEVLRRRIQTQHQEMESQTRRLQELGDFSRIHGLQLEELRSAVVTSKRDLIRAQTLEHECEHVSRIAQNKVNSLVSGGTATTASGGGETLAHVAGSMFVSALGGNRNNAAAATTANINRKNTKVAGTGVVTTSFSGRQTSPTATTTTSGKKTSTKSRTTSSSPTTFSPAATTEQQQQQQPWQLSTGNQRYNKNLYTKSSSSNVNDNNAPFGWTTARSGSPTYHQQQQAQEQEREQQQEQQQEQEQEHERQERLQRNFNDAKASSDEWMRRYVGSLRGLHLTALQTSNLA